MVTHGLKEVTKPDVDKFDMGTSRHEERRRGDDSRHRLVEQTDMRTESDMDESDMG